ncbi:MAG: DMT family transporter, partial [Chloroflexi bacterium]|nr:DMT family transporter [Chloroflexota bacterium]
AITTFYAGSKRIGAANASLVSTVEPIYTITLATILFGEALTPVQLLGGALVIGGVLLAQTARPAAAEAVEPRARSTPPAPVPLPDR